MFYIMNIRVKRDYYYGAYFKKVISLKVSQQLFYSISNHRNIIKYMFLDERRSGEDKMTYLRIQAGSE